LVHTAPIAHTSRAQLVTLMAGREVGEHIDRGARLLGAPLLKIDTLTRGDKVREVSFDVHAGEILGISGLIGAGRTELLRLIYGADKPDSGTISVGQQPLNDSAAPLQRVRIRSPAEALRHGIALITEDRKEEGLLLPQSIAANLSLGNMQRVAHYGLIDRRREAAFAQQQMDAFGVRAINAAQPVGELSGGNQQKVVIARALAQGAAILLFDEPTRGIDVRAKFDIYTLMGELARKAHALVVVSSDLRELMLICDRIGVMAAGRLTAMLRRDEWTQQALLAAAFDFQD